MHKNKHNSQPGLPSAPLTLLCDLSKPLPCTPSSSCSSAQCKHKLKVHSSRHHSLGHEQKPLYSAASVCPEPGQASFCLKAPAAFSLLSPETRPRSLSPCLLLSFPPPPVKLSAGPAACSDLSIKPQDDFIKLVTFTTSVFILGCPK